MTFERKEPYFVVRQSGDLNGTWIMSGIVRDCYTKEQNSFVAEKYKVDVDILQFDKVYRQVTTVTNTSGDDIKLSQVSSAYVGEIGRGSLVPWNSPEKYIVHYCYNTWQGEGQWRKSTLSELGLYRASNHNCANPIRFNSVGSQSTSMMYPLVFIEDTEQGQTYFFEIESGTNWYIEIGTEGTHDSACLYVELNSAFYNNDGWHKTLEPGQSYVACPAIYGCVDGNVEKAIEQLCNYKRQNSKAGLATPPVCFNDYMDCLWGKPTDKKLIPLIEKAAYVGCEVFCIDSGWYSDKDLNDILGDWEWNDEIFGEYKFEGIINYIKQKGMKPGIWLEVDSIQKQSKAATKLKDCILKRDGVYVGSSERYLLDFRKQPAREHIKAVFDKLYALGVRYVKNDYNQTCGIGFDGRDSYGEEIRQNALAFYSLADEIMAKYPDFVIENCGSGAMRTDGAIMPHFQLFSTSDQEYFYNNPSIISGTMACIQPEKCGIWSFPYPLMYEDRANKDVASFFTGENAKRYENGEETAFNMVTSMLGIVYLSGRIEYADQKNLELIKNAIEVYKQNRDLIKNSYPIYPQGMFEMEKPGFYCFGLKSSNKIMLAVWKISSTESSKTFDLAKYVGDTACAEVVYPQSLETQYNFVNGKLTVKLNEKYSARLFEITL